MLFVLMTIFGERYGVDSGAVVEVVPAVELTPSLSVSSPVVRGEFSYHGVRVPVLDGGLLIEGRPSSRSLSTRIVVLSLAGNDEQAMPFALLAEQMTETVRVEMSESSCSELKNASGDKLELITGKAPERGFRILNPFYLRKAACGT